MASDGVEHLLDLTVRSARLHRWRTGIADRLRRPVKRPPGYAHVTVMAGPPGIVVTAGAWMGSMGGWSSSDTLVVVPTDADDAELGAEVLEHLRISESAPLAVDHGAEHDRQLHGLFGVKSSRGLQHRARLVQVDRRDGEVRVTSFHPLSGGWEGDDPVVVDAPEAPSLGAAVWEAIGRATSR